MGLASSRLWRLVDRYDAAGRLPPAELGAAISDIGRAVALLEMQEAS